MKNNVIETLMGAIVLFVAGFFFVFAYQNSGSKVIDSVEYSADFDRVDGVVVGSDVRMSGVKVGIISALTIDPKTYLAKVSFTVDKSIKLPKDSSAEVVSDGLLGGKYLAIVPGGDETFLAAGNTIIHTQSSVNLEALIGQLIFSQKPKKRSENSEEK
tara:strand:+ start:3110 stop:3583 length:474 start_codon:yes stop_codon:yes gene_type:complete